ncbi:MAG: hypothetical protein C4538_05195 [Nitrospiraceae bacterium]|nr:MAG: hypothetical protein C4538_05195 [Nitrospiraceae bacterium]
MAKIMIVVDHKWRDLPSSVYLKLLLEKNYGHSVELVRLGEDSALISSFMPHMVIYNNLYEKDRNEYARHLTSCGIKILILPTEGITFSDQQTLLFTHKYSGIDFIDCYLAWNSLMHNAILENNVLPESKVSLAGNCRFDFYLPPLSRLLKDRDYFFHKYGMPLHRMNILITTNFANAEFWPDTSFLEKNLEKQRANGIPVFSDAAKLAQYEYEYRNMMFDLIIGFTKKQRGVNLLLKYHPSERKMLYQRFADELKTLNPNVFLIEGEYIWDVLNVSDLTLQRCSTVAIEAWLMGKYTAEIELLPSLDHFLQPKYREGSWTVKSVQDLSELISSISDNTLSISQEMNTYRKKIIRELIFKPDGETSKRVAETIDSLTREIHADIRKLSGVTMKNRIKSFVRRTLGMKGYDIASNLSKFKFGDYLGRYDKRFSADDVREWSEKLLPFL